MHCHWLLHHPHVCHNHMALGAPLAHLSIRQNCVDLGSHNPPAPLQVLLQGPYWPHGTTLPIIVNVLARDHEAELKLQK